MISQNKLTIGTHVVYEKDGEIREGHITEAYAISCIVADDDGCRSAYMDISQLYESKLELLKQKSHDQNVNAYKNIMHDIPSMVSFLYRHVQDEEIKEACRMQAKELLAIEL